ncbi:hypothetical protein ACFWJV_25015 [Streptomyces rochei]|uniref:hypothetical protein n=1 Tax=Streptomyces rochei TaxID=1928 RepID=UPI0027DC7A2E|nr:hypothetical protein [Streptomyces rochei]WMI56475.1 hypothetical protein RBH85_06535 [Streptomyces rochei]
MRQAGRGETEEDLRVMGGADRADQHRAENRTDPEVRVEDIQQGVERRPKPTANNWMRP